MNEFQEIALLGKFCIYHKGYNGIIHLIKLFPDDLYSKLEILNAMQPVYFFDETMSNIFSAILKQKKIKIKEKPKFMNLFLAENDAKDAIFSIDMHGNHLLSIAADKNSTSLMISVLMCVKSFCQPERNVTLNFYDELFSQNQHFISSEFKNSCEIHAKREKKYSKLVPRDTFIPKNL